MRKYLSKIVVRFIKHSQEKTYRYIKNKPKCPCFVCKAKLRYIDYRIKVDNFYTWLWSLKWINVEFHGSDYADFREYEVIGKQRIRMPDNKGLKWPKTKYHHVRMVDESLLVGAA